MDNLKELVPNSPEWIAWRKEGLGASDSNIIMRKSKFMTPRQLWNQKLSNEEPEEEEENFITNRGHYLEAKARPCFELEMDSDFPDLMAVHADYPWLRASLDGHSEELNKNWECKFVGQDDFETVKSGSHLEHYYPQIQHQLMVTGACSSYLFVIADDMEKKEAKEKFPYKTAYVEIQADLDYQKKELFPALKKFWKMVQDKKEPKIAPLDFLELSDNSELDNLLAEYELAAGTEVQAKKEKEELQKKIYKIANHCKNICNGVKITKSKSDDKIVADYESYAKSILKMEGEDLEKELSRQFFVKTTKGRITKRITFPKAEKEGEK